MSRLFAFLLPRKPPISTGAAPTPRALPPDTDGSMTMMAKGVNDVLNYYVQLTDTKASIFIAGSVAAASFLLMHFPEGVQARALYFTSAASLGVALVLATLVILPRLPMRSGRGCVFWGDIADCADAAAYRDRFGAAAASGILDEEYAVLNFYTARILERKIRILRRGILFFLTGVLMAIPHHLMNQ